MVLGCLRSNPLREHTKYLGRRMRLPLCPLTNSTREDRIFAALQMAIPKPKARECRLIAERVSAYRDSARDQAHIRRPGCTINASLKEDMRKRTEEAGEEVERFIGADPPLHREAWHRMKGWYQATVDCAPPPARVALEWITAERMDLYCHVPPLRENIPVSVEEIKWAVKQIQNHRSGGPLGMRAENLKGWLAGSGRRRRRRKRKQK